MQAQGPWAALAAPRNFCYPPPRRTPPLGGAAAEGPSVFAATKLAKLLVALQPWRGPGARWGRRRRTARSTCGPSTHSKTSVQILYSVQMVESFDLRCCNLALAFLFRGLYVWLAVVIGRLH